MQKFKTPLIIYVAEHHHNDMAYALEMQQIIDLAKAKGQKVQTFSEFPSQSKKAEHLGGPPDMITKNSPDGVGDRVQEAANF